MTRQALTMIGVLGAGTIGRSWVSLFVSAGYQVRVWDPNAPCLDNFGASVVCEVDMARRISGNTGPIGRWDFVSSVTEAVSGCCFVQESGPEDLRQKRSLLDGIATVLHRDAVVASSSSSLMPSDLQRDLPFAERVLIGHPFNPPHIIPLVEVVGGRETSEVAIGSAMRLYRDLGKHPIRIRAERPGHLANRLQAALWREAVDLVVKGVASVAEVDAAVTYGLGPRWAVMGPHMTFHVAGGDGGFAGFLDHLGSTFVALWHDLQESALTEKTQSMLIEGVQESTGDNVMVDLIKRRDEKLARLLKAISTVV